MWKKPHMTGLSQKTQNIESCWLYAEIQYSKYLKDNKNEELEQGFTTGLVYSP